jgi:hypothetical protein
LILIQNCALPKFKGSLVLPLVVVPLCGANEDKEFSHGGWSLTVLSYGNDNGGGFPRFAWDLVRISIDIRTVSMPSIITVGALAAGKPLNGV